MEINLLTFYHLARKIEFTVVLYKYSSFTNFEVVLAEHVVCACNIHRLINRCAPCGIGYGKEMQNLSFSIA